MTLVLKWDCKMQSIKPSFFQIENLFDNKLEFETFINPIVLNIVLRVWSDTYRMTTF